MSEEERDEQGEAPEETPEQVADEAAEVPGETTDEAAGNAEPGVDEETPESSGEVDGSAEAADPSPDAGLYPRTEPVPRPEVSVEGEPGPRQRWIELATSADHKDIGRILIGTAVGLAAKRADLTRSALPTSFGRISAESTMPKSESTASTTDRKREDSKRVTSTELTTK